VHAGEMHPMPGRPLIDAPRRAVAWSAAAAGGAAIVGGAVARRMMPSRPVTPPAAWMAAPGLVNTPLVSGGPARIEPSVAVSPADPDRLIAAFRTFRGTWAGVATAVSVDGGRTWADNGLLPGPVPDLGSNAVVAFDQAGRGFVAGIEATSRAPRRGTAQVWRTGGGGRSYGAPVTAIAPRSGLADHPGLAADRDAPGVLYLTAVLAASRRSELVFCRSADGGASFEPARRIGAANGAVAPVLAAGPAGSVCVIYLEPGPDGLTLMALASEDRGAVLGPPARLLKAARLAPGLGRVSAKSGPAVAAAPGHSDLYAALTRHDAAAGRSEILIVWSPDAGRRWAPPVTAAASTGHVYLQPHLAVSAAGRVGLSAYALDAARRQADVLLFQSPAGRPRFGAPRRVTTRSFDPARAGGTGRSPWLGNYQGLAAVGNAFCVAWTGADAGTAQVFTAVAPAAD
jgi:hypothetical protein